MASPEDVTVRYAGEVHGELVTDGDASALTVTKLYKDGTVTEITELGARQKLVITDYVIGSESGGDTWFVADSKAAGRYIFYANLAGNAVIDVSLRTPYACPAGVIPKFQGAAQGVNSVIFQGHIQYM